MDQAATMNLLANMGILNLATSRWHGQEWQSRCKLAMPELAIHFGYHQATSPKQQTGPSRQIALATHPQFPAGCW